MARDRSLDIAVTGIAARFPGAVDLGDWWSALKDGRVLTRRYERHELIAAGVPEHLVEDPDYVPVHGHLEDADRFEHTLFRVSPRDAEMMDPQHRLMLETAWAALEDAGAGSPRRRPKTAVYATASSSGYLRAMVAGGALDDLTLEDALHGTEPDFLAGLIAYRLGLTGPAVAVQTACSSSLVAVHLAVQALLNGDCDQALIVAAGVPFPQAGQRHVEGGIHTATGRCRPFDAHADGVLAGSGVASVVLRRLTDALADGPQAYGVLLGTAVNNDGSTKAGFYAPSEAGQEAVIRSALQAAEVDADSVGYLETHGTGTRIGDPIEWSAASAAYGGSATGPRRLAVGALKANVGHLDNAAGVAALIKALLVVQHGVVPPVAGFTRLNPLLETESSPLYVPVKLGPWTGPEPRRAGVSAFGIGGTNAHVIVEQAPPVPAAPPRVSQEDRLLLLSAADPEALARSAARLREHLMSAERDLDDVSFTLAAGRSTLPERLAVTANSTAEAGQQLASQAELLRGRRQISEPAPVVLLFPGQGSQYPGMAVPFVRNLPGFREVLDDCLEAFGPPLAGPLRRALLDPGSCAAELDRTELAQPALFAVEYSAATALRELGVAPVALVGHSLGEISAACVAGVLDLDDAARLVAVRGQAMQDCPEGAMIALGCDAAAAEELVARSEVLLETAALNGPDSTVLAGTPDMVEAFQSWLGERVFSRRLRGDRAFHSTLVEPALPPLAAALARIDLHRPLLPFASSASGCLVPAGAVVGPDLLVEQARRPVRFAQGLAEVADRHQGAVAVEVGPRRVLSALAEAAGLDAVPLSPARTERPDREVLAALGTLWTQKQPLNLDLLCGTGRRVHLPGYPFAGPRWLAPEAAPRATANRFARPQAQVVPARERPVDPAAALAVDPAERLAAVWRELLGHNELGADSDFFLLGGDSLLITRLVRRVEQELGVKVPVRAMLAGRTLGRQIELLRGALTP